MSPSFSESDFVISDLINLYSPDLSQEPYLMLRNAIVDLVKAPFKRFHRAPSVEEFRALKDVSFNVEQGEVMEIIRLGSRCCFKDPVSDRALTSSTNPF